MTDERLDLLVLRLKEISPVPVFLVEEYYSVLSVSIFPVNIYISAVKCLRLMSSKKQLTVILHIDQREK